MPNQQTKTPKLYSRFSRNLFSIFIISCPSFSIAETLQSDESTTTQSEQNSSREGSLVLEEIMVTAQKRTQSLRDVPSSVATFGGDALDVLTSPGSDIRDLAGRVPSLNAEGSNGNIMPRFYIRGLGNTDFDLNASQPVGIYVDGVVK
jgi:iron complex outermembrane receptor protein